MRELATRRTNPAIRRLENPSTHPSGESRRITSKGQVTIPRQIRRRYGITPQTKLKFLPQPDGFLVRLARERGDFGALAGSASKHWTVDAMLKRLEELRRENV